MSNEINGKGWRGTMYGNATLAKSQPRLYRSQLSFRVGLCRGRTAAYPMHKLDFIMMDLERPLLSHRHADWCTGDLSGRVLEFLSAAEGVDELLAGIDQHVRRHVRCFVLFEGNLWGVPHRMRQINDDISGCGVVRANYLFRVKGHALRLDGDLPWQ